jgi:hypothetical protein
MVSKPGRKNLKTDASPLKRASHGQRKPGSSCNTADQTRRPIQFAETSARRIVFNDPAPSTHAAIAILISHSWGSGNFQQMISTGMMQFSDDKRPRHLGWNNQHSSSFAKD